MDYELIEAKPTAKCSQCGAKVKLDVHSFPATVKNACKHYAGRAEIIEGIPFVAFYKPKETTCPSHEPARSAKKLRH